MTSDAFHRKWWLHAPNHASDKDQTLIIPLHPHIYHVYILQIGTPLIEKVDILLLFHPSVMLDSSLCQQVPSRGGKQVGLKLGLRGVGPTLDGSNTYNLYWMQVEPTPGLLHVERLLLSAIFFVRLIRDWLVSPIDRERGAGCRQVRLLNSSLTWSNGDQKSQTHYWSVYHTRCRSDQAVPPHESIHCWMLI